MRWVDDGVILNIKPTGENSATLSILTAQQGKYMGLFSGVKNKKNKAFLQIGSQVKATWQARLDNQLGRFTLEPQQLYWSQLMDNPVYLDSMVSALTLINQLLPERQSYPHIYQSLIGLLEHINSPYWAILYIRWEIQLLADIGFGLDLSQCALTGSTENLAWVSPNSGKAACYSAGLPWKEQLLPLPKFIISTNHIPTNKDLIDGFRLSGFFLQKSLDFHQAILPAARERLIVRLI
ncbi:MAG: DNA repair protein RecO [Alphaproteobacteria bacterium]